MRTSATGSSPRSRRRAAASVAVAAIVRPPWPSFRRLAVLRDVLGDRVVAVLTVVVAVETCYLLALALVTPPNDIDALTYHLMRGALWIQQQAVAPVGGIADTRIDEFQPDANILQAATMLLSGSARFAQLVALAALVAATLAIYGLASRIGLDRRRAAFGALLFPTLPIVALQASTAMTDIVVAGLVATAAFFLLGRSPGELGLACLTIALLIGTKVTGLLSLPLLLAIALLTLRGRRLVLALAGGAAACLVGGAWFAVNLHEGEGAFGTVGQEASGADDGVASMVARATRYAIQTVELPGATGRDVLLYLVAAVSIGVVGLALARPVVALTGAALAALPLLALPLENVLHRIWWRSLELVGQGSLTRYDPGRDPTIASNSNSWYGPVGVALAVVALVLVLRDVRRRALPPTAVVLVAAPCVLIVGSAVAVGYNSGERALRHGRRGALGGDLGRRAPHPGRGGRGRRGRGDNPRPLVRQLRGEARRDPAHRGARTRVDLANAAGVGAEHSAGARARDAVRPGSRDEGGHHRVDARLARAAVHLRRLARPRLPCRVRGQPRRGHAYRRRLGRAPR